LATTFPVGPRTSAAGRSELSGITTRDRVCPPSRLAVNVNVLPTEAIEELAKPL
jgi:hypothetical protein